MQRTKTIHCLILTFALTLFAGVAFADDASCRQAFDGWLELNKSQLPQSLDEMATLDRGEQRFAFAAISPELRADLWRSHIERYLDQNRGELDRAQVAVLESAAKVVGPRLFQTPEGDPAYAQLVKRPLEKLSAQAYAAFSDEQIAVIFYQLGPNGERAATKMGSCNCDHSFDCRGPYNINGHCIKFGFNCLPVNYGCGFLWLFGCEGLCSI